MSGTVSGGRHALRDPRPEVEPVAIGDPGRAARAVIPQPDRRFPFRPAIVLDGVRIEGSSDAGGLEVRAASRRGLSHQYYGTTRQDEFGFLVTQDRRWLVVSVADGVSAGEYSHRAAEIVTREGCTRIAGLLTGVAPAALDWNAVLGEVSAVVVGQVRAELDLPGADLRQVADRAAATALFAVVAVDPDDGGGRTVHVMSLGDTSAWLLHSERETRWTPLQAVKNAGAAVASSATAAVPLIPRELPPPVAARLDQDGVLVLMTDGVGDALGGGTGEVGDHLARAWQRPPDPLNFAAQVGFARRSYDDDRTVVAVWPTPAPS
ncbi:MAG TPA: protein phosphatase 2C domain-containing protein [Actinophytocola sp.]|uniref:protein phosphatase 2C domain-containing protein n=1 Tax=Actinophytocola sp. TaxID=1872138 RepID=UPI002DBBC438|nr:protein phosphatase 2C domain-containing protein [Actinophytocola sp.]HEU5470197.1 protein phosphatase 2C domain-containing protein [Actinophytocola sp.]